MSNTYDAIVIGSGISGGWAAMELCKKGYKTIVLERGRNVKHGDYPTANMDPWELPNNNMVSAEEKALHYFKQSKLNWWVTEDVKPWINKDSDYGYDEVKPFAWIRGHHMGGRSIMWGRHCYRHSDLDFEANAKDGHGVDWPIRYKDIAPWYDYAETFVGVSGQKEGLPQVPDGKYLAPFPLNCIEQHLRGSVQKLFPESLLTPGRVANLSEYNPDIHKGSRSQCQSRNRCTRGCPFGAAFGSLNSTLIVAANTNNLTLRPDSIVAEILFDTKTRKAKGVRVKDAQTGEEVEFFAKVIFCNASTVGSTAILLNSRSNEFPNGLGNTSGELGHNLMDHHYEMGAGGRHEGFTDKYYKGRKPWGFYIPRFRNINEKTKRTDYLRGFGYQGTSSRGSNVPAGVYGEALKTAITKPGDWNLQILGFGEMLPYHENRMYLNFDKKDKHGMPAIVFDAELKENEMKMREDAVICASEMLDSAGFKDINTWNDKKTLVGACIHEMGTARMGRDPKTSVLNEWNQVWDCPNVFVTDGACMTSSATQNPSITYMALTARAVDHAHNLMKRGEL